MKIYLCGITANQYHNIKELTDPVYKEVDGLIFVCDEKTDDGTFELLEERKGCGQIFKRKWSNSHDHNQNVFLLEGPMQDGDFFLLRDSMERFNPEWIKNIRSFVEDLEKEGICSIFNYNKGFMFKKNDSMIFQNSPHWHLLGIRNKIIDLSHYFDENKHEHTWRIRDGEKGGRPIDNKIDHEAKYAWVYGRSNHLLLGMEDKYEEFQRAENIRQQARLYAKDSGIAMTIEGLKEFIGKVKAESPENLVAFINSHRVWKNFYRFHFLKHNFEVINLTENNWVLKK